MGKAPTDRLKISCYRLENAFKKCDREVKKVDNMVTPKMYL